MTSEPTYRTILLFGAPGVGKGTQGKLLGSIPGLCHIATGDMFRGLDPASPLGVEVAQYSTKGLLVPDELTVRLWRRHMQGLIEARRYRPEVDLLILDGIPRSVNQAQAIAAHVEVLAVIHLTAPDLDEMVERMKRRAVQQNRRDDADEGVIRRRFEVYERETAPVLRCYPTMLVRNIQAVGSPARVLLHVLEAVVPIYDRNFGNPLE
jgi:adenylate kinase